MNGLALTAGEGEVAVVEGAMEALAKAARLSEELAAAAREREFRVRAESVLKERLEAAVGLPEVVRRKLGLQLAVKKGDVARYGGVEAYEEAVAAAFESEVVMMREMVEMTRARGIVRGCGAVVAVDERERQALVAQLAMDRLLGAEGGTGDDDVEWRRAREMGLVASVPRWTGVREAYARITGDAAISGVANPAGSVVREANEVTTGVMANALVNSMHKRLVREYRKRPQHWRKHCVVVPLSDFKAQHRVQLYDFASLSVVAEGAAYTNQAWGAAREVYTPAKRGNLVTVTRETILNDDLRTIARIPEKLGQAAYVTMREFVYGLFTGNPTMNDDTKVFDDGVQTSHGNRGTAALSFEGVKAGLTAMLKQTSTSGKRLGLRPRYLLVPAELSHAARVLTESERVPGGAANDANVLKDGLEPIAVPSFTDATDWFLVCEPGESETIEIGFVGGREEPELLIQDSPRQGQVFTNDLISIKVRWEFGGGWVDYRGAYWSQVTG